MPMNPMRAVQLLHRPHCILPEVAVELAARIRALDERAFERHAGPFAVLRQKGLTAARALLKPRSPEANNPSAAASPDIGAYAPLWAGEPDTVLDFGITVRDGIAMAEVAGPIAERGEWVCGTYVFGYDTIAAMADLIDHEPAVKAALIRFDTPGGVVASGLYDLADKLQARRGDSNRKPIWAHCEMACSAGYWIASQCDRVVAPKAGLVGSIGAVIVHQSIAGALKEMGVAVTAIQFGDHKTDGAMWKDLSPDAAARLQTLIDEIGESFLAAVAAGRGAKFGAEAARETQARVYSASEALSLGMIDAIMSEEAAFAELRDQVAAKPAPVFQIRPAASASRSQAAAAAQPTESSMKLTASHLPALAAAMAADPAFAARVATAIGGDGPGEGGGDPDEEDDEDEDEITEGGEASQAPAAAPAAVVDPAVAQAVLNLPEAKGREKLAQRLAFEPGMTTDKAKAYLADAPKASRLAERAIDPKLSADGGGEDGRTEQVRLAHAGLALAGFTKKAG